MIGIPCRRCGSLNLRRNGRTATGQQKFHWKDCNAYGTLDTKEQERQVKRATVEKLHLERLSQRAIARTTGMSRMTVAAILKKSPDTDRSNHPPTHRTSNS
jgi:transposase-like protein